jgi:hypothetical protein
MDLLYVISVALLLAYCSTTTDYAGMDWNALSPVPHKVILYVQLVSFPVQCPFGPLALLTL